ncbi:SCO3933 family regulatory protein [Streptomyces sp. SD15]
MPATIIRVRTEGAVYLVITPPAPKVRNTETGEIAKHRESGQLLFTVSLAETADGRAQILKLTVPENGLSKNLTVGQPVTPVNLTATPWARMFTADQLSEGVVYRADALEAVK